MTIQYEVKGLDELRERFRQFPNKYRDSVKKGLDMALLVIWEEIPAYPNQRPNTNYIRQGTLGTSLGVGMNGAKLGSNPSIYQVKMSGMEGEARFGTNLEYAPYVIDDLRQARMHRGRWWHMKFVMGRSQRKIEKVFETVAQKLAAFLDRGSSL